MLWMTKGLASIPEGFKGFDVHKVNSELAQLS